MLDLGYHRDRPLHRYHQLYRRVFWCCYVWDKLIGIERASLFQRPFARSLRQLAHGPTVLAEGKPWMLRRVDSDTKLISEDMVRPLVQHLLAHTDEAPSSARGARGRLRGLHRRAWACPRARLVELQLVLPLGDNC